MTNLVNIVNAMSPAQRHAAAHFAGLNIPQSLKGAKLSKRIANQLAELGDKRIEETLGHVGEEFKSQWNIGDITKVPGKAIKDDGAKYRATGKEHRADVKAEFLAHMKVIGGTGGLTFTDWKEKVESNSKFTFGRGDLNYYLFYGHVEKVS